MSTENNGSTKVYRPELTPDTVCTLTRRLYGLSVVSCHELNSYDDRNFHVMVDHESVDNSHLGQVWPQGYVFKVLNSLDSRRPDVVTAKDRMILHVHKAGIPVSCPVLTKSGHLYSLQAIPREKKDELKCDLELQDTDEYLVRLYQFVPGTVLASVTLTPDICFQVGQQAGRLDRALKDFDDHGLPEMLVKWNLQTVPDLRDRMYVVRDEQEVKVMTAIIDAFESQVLMQEDKFQTGLIHSDLNDHNILVRQDNDDGGGPSNVQICGILDFGDATKSLLLFEVALAMTYMILATPKTLDPDVFAGHVLAGYLSEMNLSKEELRVLPVTVCARFCQTLILAYHTMSLESCSDYITLHMKKVWPHLRHLWYRPLELTLDLWKRVVESRGIEFP